MIDSDAEIRTPEELEQCFKRAAESVGMVWEISGIDVRICIARLTYGEHIEGALKPDNRFVILSEMIYHPRIITMGDMRGREGLFADFSLNFSRR